MIFWRHYTEEKNKKINCHKSKLLFILTNRVAWRFELASSISGSGDGFGDFDDDCMLDVCEAGGASSLLIFALILLINFSMITSFFDMIFTWEIFLFIFFYSLFTTLTSLHLPLLVMKIFSYEVNLEDNKSLWML